MPERIPCLGTGYIEILQGFVTSFQCDFVRLPAIAAKPKKIWTGLFSCALSLAHGNFKSLMHEPEMLPHGCAVMIQLS